MALDAVTPDTPDLFHASDRVRATRLKGSEQRLVVSFTGVGRRKSKAQPEEFAGAAHMAGRNHVLFVADRLRSWYNAPGLFEEIIDLVESYKRTHKIADVMTLGEGMGGYGAILFARALSAQNSVSFSAQYSVDPKVVPEEGRWLEYRARITHFTRPPLETVLSEDCTYFAVHTHSDQDKPHWARFPRAAHMDHYLAGHSEASLTRKMASEGKLHGIVHCGILGRPVAFRRGLKEVFDTLRQVDKP
ncbi:MAG: hypothetical protein AAGL23_13185 [Pseudomonadota bacterium]